MISETSWHDGHQEQAERYPWIRHKGDWLMHVWHECQAAAAMGHPVEGICWYPVVNCPPWHAPHEPRWDQGLIREDLSVDPNLAAAIARVNAATQQREAA